MMNNAQNVPAINEPHREGDKNVVIWLCATPFDDISKFLSGLFEGFPDLPKPMKLFTMEQATSYEQLMESVERDETEVILVFSGHGASDALLGAPKTEGGFAEGRAKPSNFYDLEHFDLGPGALVAFCCSAGSVLGEAFKQALGRAFIGFAAPIGFVTAGSVYFDAWQKILHQSTLKILSTSQSRELKAFVRDLYLDAYNYFKSDEGQKNEWSFWMTLLIRGHLDALRVYGR